MDYQDGGKTKGKGKGKSGSKPKRRKSSRKSSDDSVYMHRPKTYADLMFSPISSAIRYPSTLYSQLLLDMLKHKKTGMPDTMSFVSGPSPYSGIYGPSVMPSLGVVAGGKEKKKVKKVKKNKTVSKSKSSKLTFMDGGRKKKRKSKKVKKVKKLSI